MRTEVHIATREVAPSTCPGCQAVLDGRAGASFDGPVDFVNIVGVPTVCAYCGVIAVFADQSGRMRYPTPEETASFEASPEIMAVVAFAREWIAKRKQAT